MTTLNFDIYNPPAGSIKLSFWQRWRIGQHAAKQIRKQLEPLWLRAGDTVNLTYTLRIGDEGTIMNIEELVQAYITAALWSSVDDNGDPLDKDHDASDVAPETLAAARYDCEQFVERAGRLLIGWDAQQIGHDFWLTRNRHGAGFWDRNLPNADALTDLAHQFSELDLYVGDDGLIRGFGE